MKYISENYDNIVREICGGVKFYLITELKINGADTDHNGRKVIQCLLDNGKRFVYKPRSMTKEIHYHVIYTAFCKKVGLPINSFSVINKDTYSISEYLEGIECNQIGEVQNYYKCIGVHLFPCYLLHTGILAVPIWKHNKKGVVISVLHSDKEVYSSLKFPVIINQRTTNMKVIYDNLKIKSTSQTPKYYGKKPCHPNILK